MYKYLFQNDYAEGAHLRIIEALARTNMEQQAGYGEDQYCLAAAEAIRKATGTPQAAVHFMSGGTQTNLVFLASVLRPFESVIAADSGHVCVHETGAIEATGHKVHHLPSHDGKLAVSEIRSLVAEHYFEHMVRPRVVYISQSTELGTIYTANELRELSAACKELNLLLYMDGARLGAAVTSPAADFTLPELAALVDAFYIGGAKNGALIGEALVINNPALQADFRYHMKQRGALLSKGRLLGLQFLELFRDDLYFELARHANRMAARLSSGIAELGYGFLFPSPTNQIFPIFPAPVITALSELYCFYEWSKVDETRSAVRLVTSWATPQAAVDEFLSDLRALSAG